MKIRRILVPTDFSEASAPAVVYAVGLAHTFDAEVVLFHAVEPSVFAGDGTVAVGSVVDELERTAHGQLKKRVDRLKARGVNIRGMVGFGYAAALISETAAKLEIDLIVMGTHGRAGFSRLLIGSVAEKVVRIASCPVLTVHADAEAETSRRVKKRPIRVSSDLGSMTRGAER